MSGLFGWWDDKAKQIAAMENRRKSGIDVEEVLGDHLRDLASDKAEAREHSVRALAFLGPQVAVHERCAEALKLLHGLALEDEEGPVRKAAVWALGEIGMMGSVAVLRQVIDTDEEFYVRRQAEEELGKVLTDQAEAQAKHSR